MQSAAAAVDLQLAEMNPPAGQYCGVRYRVAPADADAVGVSETPPMLGRSFYLQGSMESLGEQLAALEVSSARTVDIALDADFELSVDIRSMTLPFELDPELWFQNLDRTLSSGTIAESAVVESFRGALSLRVQ